MKASLFLSLCSPLVSLLSDYTLLLKVLKSSTVISLSSCTLGKSLRKCIASWKTICFHLIPCMLFRMDVSLVTLLLLCKYYIVLPSLVFLTPPIAPCWRSLNSSTSKTSPLCEPLCMNLPL